MDWVQITNLVCNTLSLIALAWIGQGIALRSHRERQDQDG